MSLLHPLLANRSSPTFFDPTSEVTDDEIESMLEAARWAPAADLLVANLAHRYVEDTDWDYSEFSLYDLGQAVAHMTIQAQALGLRVRQFRAFDRDGIAADFAVPAHWQVCTLSAIGHVPTGSAPAGPASPPSRTRRPTPQLRWPDAALDQR